MDTMEKTRELDDVLDGLCFAMVATSEDGTWKSRPLTLAGQDGASLRFLVAETADRVEAIDTAGSPTTVTFSDPGKKSTSRCRPPPAPATIAS